MDEVAPAVFGAEHEHEPETEEVAPLPETDYVPSEPVEQSSMEVTGRLGRNEDNELVLMAFRSPERLAACLGDEQHWLAVLKAELDNIRQRSGAVNLELDPVLPQAGRQINPATAPVT